ncbi:GbsR/MarR family transcriptional regulator [Streptomyces sp. NPDC057302]|uniref:GbsR/MarR family transcriptional regulator n=1 Tax=Streptomyces sp. NPDC057302 TaxID=3346094 RepID=UPI003642C4BE
MSQAAEHGKDDSPDAPDAPDALVEEFGTHVGRAMGWPRMAGRAAGLLMLSDKPLTLTQLQEALDASKGSASEMTRLLIANGTVERYKEAGARHFVYRWRDDAWVGCLRHIVAATTELRELATHAQERGADMSEEQRERLRDMHDYYRFMVRHLESMLAEYTATWTASRDRP